MKKTGIYLLLAVATLAVFWLALHQSKSVQKKAAPSQVTNQTASKEPPLIIGTNQLPTAAPETELPRPAGIDDAGWNWLMKTRKLALEENQPVEFYARVVDQNTNPVQGAVLSITVSRIDEKMFETTEFFHRKMGDEIVQLSLKLTSDSDGWIRISKMTGTALRVESLTKEGYSWTMPQIDSFAYEPNGQRTVGYAGMEDAFNPAKGYIFHLQKE